MRYDAIRDICAWAWAFNGKCALQSGAWKAWLFAKQGVSNTMTPLSRIMGSVGYSFMGARPIPGTRSQDASAFAAPILTILFVCVLRVP